MQIFFCHTNPYIAATMIPKGQQAHHLGMACKLLAEVNALPPVLATRYPPKGKNFVRFMEDYPEYHDWVLSYAYSLFLLRRKWTAVEGARTLQAAEDLFLQLGGVTSQHSLPLTIPVSLPTSYARNVCLPPIGLYPMETAIELYAELLDWTYGTSFKNAG